MSKSGDGSANTGDARFNEQFAKWQAQFSADQRKQLVERSNSDSAPLLIAAESDTDKAQGYHFHNMLKDPNTKNFDQKIYMFPPAFNALREELYKNWPTLWALVSYRMAYLPEEFAQMMNDATSLRVVFDSGAVNWMCNKWLYRLIEMRMKGTAS